jgi:hypothetical protein
MPTAGCTSSYCIAHHIVQLYYTFICSAAAPEVQAVADAAVMIVAVLMPQCATKAGKRCAAQPGVTH